MALRVNADFENADVRLDGTVPKGAALKIRCEIVNRSAETWLTVDGWAVGYHLFDEPTGTLVVDGERTPLDLAPAQRGAFSFEMNLPPEPDDPELLATLDGGIDDPDGVGLPRARARDERDEGWDLDA